MDNLPHRNLFNLGSNHDGKEAFIAISPINLPALKRFSAQLKLKSYSATTARNFRRPGLTPLSVIKIS